MANALKLYAENILIGSQWQQNKTLSINEAGLIIAIDEGKLAGAQGLSGPVIPGMVNCHSHAFQRAFAGFSEYRANASDSFWSWRDIMYRFVARMTPDDAYHIARFLYTEMLKAGYTSVAEFHYLHHQAGGVHYDKPAEMSLQILNAASSSGIALTHLPVLYTFAGFGEQQPSEAQGRFIHQTDDFFKLLESLNKTIKAQPLARLGVAPHSLRAVSQDQLDQLVPFMTELNSDAPIHVHIAEQTQEVDDCVNHYGKRPVEWLLDNYAVDNNWCLIHATHLNSAEVAALAASKAIAGICPTTEANLGDGIFPAVDYLAKGGSMAIGSDSHIAVNVADEIRSLEYSQRLALRQRSLLTGENCPSVGQNLYVQLAEQGAAAIGQNCGIIGVGKRADLLVLDGNHASLYGKQGSFILDAAIFACPSLPIRDVMVGGQWQVEAGKHKQEEAALASYLKVMDKLTA